MHAAKQNNKRLWVSIVRLFFLSLTITLTLPLCRTGSYSTCLCLGCWSFLKHYRLSLSDTQMTLEWRGTHEGGPGERCASTNPPSYPPLSDTHTHTNLSADPCQWTYSITPSPLQKWLPTNTPLTPQACCCCGLLKILFWMFYFVRLIFHCAVYICNILSCDK